ncbi:heavy metal translocatin [Fragilariopsis cylindrus CCMP1102]|uniref:Heavy metal translocatin n=1 Tax=Fragilariopsis cylindrus CCMP1102 TaxID=635003 RepID=A0A1E7F5Z4_9STRA|nr:heavy metal translocatin [Fragilariopsis cylindrus CCMP1102]|eukprot:OEU13570.1 heavy metal translocatin [Fragilariopsis cylindrus CCMP1102]
MHNDTLVLRSLIRAIPGVRKVTIPNNIQQQTHNNDSNSERIIIIHHDASVHTKIILHALESAGHSAFVRDNTTTTSNAVITTNVLVNESNHNNHNNDPNQNQKCWVRSSFNVQGVCCASEIPAVRKIVRPLWGVGKVNINLTTKVVHVQHNYIQIQASQIAQKLTEQGFPAHIYKDGAATVQGQIQFGFFWVLSMVSIVNGIDWFKYFGLASVLFGLPPIIIKAYRTLKRCQFDANCMMVTAALGALALGQYDEAASVSFLFAVSEFLEASATTKARKALSEICALRPDHANVIHPISKEIVVVPADRVPLGSLISVRTGDKIAADGVILEGSTAIDESSLTGESTPAHKIVGDEVSGGTINIGQTQLVVKTTTTVEDSAVSRLIRLVEEAQSNRSPTEKMVDAFAQSYTPFVIFIASLMCTIPWAFGTDIGRHWTLNGLIIVVIACPCALTISTPVTYAAGLAATAKRGVIIKGGAKLEAMGSVDRVVFDKTGTLTKGKFSVTHLEVISSSKTRQEMLELLSLMQERASHPIASSLVQAAKAEGVNVPRQMSVTDHQILKGEGIMAKINGKIQVYVGNQRLFNRLGMLELLSPENKNLVEEWGDSGGTLGFIGSREDGIIGMFCVKDSVREEAREAIDELKEAGIEAWICTGDSDATAQAVAKEIGIPEHCVNSQLLPEDKLQFVKGLKRPRPKKFALCREKRYVLFCGDGVNDAPALAAAQIGVSMGEGAAMALEMSDVTLMDSRLTKLTYAIRMGQRVLRTVKENIIISFVAKLLIIVLTFMGKMTLLYAIAADVGVMLLVTLNGMKLLPNTSFDLVSPRRSRRGRAIIKQRVGIGTNTDFELVRMKTSRSCSDDSIDSFEPDVSEII